VLSSGPPGRDDLRPPMLPNAATTDTMRFRWSARAVLIGSVAVLVIYVIRHGWGAVGALAVAATAVFLSKLSIFGGNIPNNPFNPWELGLIAWMLDLWVSCALLAGLASFEKLPIAGKALAEAHLRAHQTLLQYPGLRRLAFWGIAVLVFLPIPGSGAVTGTLVAQIVGLSRMASFVSVALGAALAVSVYAAVAVLASEHGEKFLTNPLVIIAAVLGLILLFWYAWMRIKKELQRS
jgi:hypothetical protein